MWGSVCVKGAIAGAVAAVVLPAEPALARQDTVAALAGRCPTTRNLARSNWDAVASGERLDEWEARIRGPLPFEHPADATVVLRAFGGRSETQDTPTDSVALVWRDAAGTWRFRKIDHRTIAQPPPAPGTQPVDVERFRRDTHEGVLSGGQAAALERLLADPCLDAEPTVIGPQLELREGLAPGSPCYSGAGGTVQLRRGRGPWKTFSLFCPRLLSGDLLRLALYPMRDEDLPARRSGPLYPDVAAARAAADQMLSVNRSAFENVTSSTVPELLHRPSGLRCRFEMHYNVALSTTGDRGERSAYCALRLGSFGVWTAITRAGGDASVRDELMDFATTEISNAWMEREVRYAGRPARLGRLRYQTAAFSDGPRADAREEEYRRVNAAEIDGWILAQVTVGTTERSAEADAVAAAAWARLVSARIAGVPDAPAAAGAESTGADSSMPAGVPRRR